MCIFVIPHKVSRNRKCRSVKMSVIAIFQLWQPATDDKSKRRSLKLSFGGCLSSKLCKKIQPKQKRQFCVTQCYSTVKNRNKILVRNSTYSPSELLRFQDIKIEKSPISKQVSIVLQNLHYGTYSQFNFRERYTRCSSQPLNRATIVQHYFGNTGIM